MANSRTFSPAIHSIATLYYLVRPLGFNLRGAANIADTNHAVARDQLCQLILAPVLSTGRLFRQYEIAQISIAIMYANLPPGGQFGAELLKNRAGLTNSAGAVVAAFVPRRRNSQDRARVTGTQSCLLYTSPSPRDRG